jgi:hypothetical protein
VSGQIAVRPATQDDVPAPTARLAADHDHLAPWDPPLPGYPCTAGGWQEHVLFQLLHEPGMR